MIGKILGGTFKILAKTLVRIPIIGMPIFNILVFFFDNLFKAIKRLPYVIGGAFVIFIILMFMGVI